MQAQWNHQAPRKDPRLRIAHVRASYSEPRNIQADESENDFNEDFFRDTCTDRPQSAQACCYGCGAPIQLDTTAAAGFVDPSLYELKRRHRHLSHLLCARCQALSNGAMIPGVADFSQQRPSSGFADTKLLATPEELRDQLKGVRTSRALVVLLVDLLDASGSVLTRIRDLVGANPIIAIGTKADLLPRGTDLEEVTEWLRGALAFKRVTTASVHLVSSRTGDGVAQAVGAVRKERLGRDVYIVGAANVGKSAFVRALVKDMASMGSRQYDPGAMAKSKRLPVESAMPGTTLQAIPLEVFSAGGVLYDTPGLHLHHRVPHMLTPEENKQLHPRKKLRGYVPSAPQEVIAAHSSTTGGGDGTEEGVASYMWGALAKLDIVPGVEDVKLVFYGPPALKVKVLNNSPNSSSSSTIGQQDSSGVLDAPGNEAGTERMGKKIENESDSVSGELSEEVPFATESVQVRGGLRVAKTVTVDAPPRGAGLEPVVDIAVSGVPGWVAVYCSGRKGDGQVELCVSAPVGVEVFIRPSMPMPAPLLQA